LGLRETGSKQKFHDSASSTGSTLSMELTGPQSWGNVEKDNGRGGGVDDLGDI